jgi:hypothetical protein
LFKSLWLYDWDIDWNYKSIEPQIINYQIKAWIIKNKDSWWAWYFWKKTIKSLLSEYKDKFKSLAQEHIVSEEVLPWKRKFIVTAYYSALPNQKHYSYSIHRKRYRTYYEELKLQWWWKVWASWKKVFSWMIAAPKNYKFWTKIYLEWIWVWVVEDRWGSIVNAWDKWHEFDRIDIWMWYWYEWLIRAKNWWQREVYWEILDDNFDYKYNITFNDNISDKYPFIKQNKYGLSLYNTLKLDKIVNELNSRVRKKSKDSIVYIININKLKNKLDKIIKKIDTNSKLVLKLNYLKDNLG